ncbi:MAG: hypothetical protein KBS47_01050 [Bacteroidales bacterium]|nr:hypothetical protein [Candidatus Equimonas enterica]
MRHYCILFALLACFAFCACESDEVSPVREHFAWENAAPISLKTFQKFTIGKIWAENEEPYLVEEMPLPENAQHLDLLGWAGEVHEFIDAQQIRTYAYTDDEVEFHLMHGQYRYDEQTNWLIVTYTEGEKTITDSMYIYSINSEMLTYIRYNKNSKTARLQRLTPASAEDLPK